MLTITIKASAPAVDELQRLYQKQLEEDAKEAAND